METARAAMNLEGVRFQYFTCPQCGHDLVFLEIAQLPGEPSLGFQERKEALTRVVEEVKTFRTTVLVVE